ncbi:MAG: hypothetical protein WBW56_16110 [Syntrophobacteraceae bacterium]
MEKDPFRTETNLLTWICLFYKFSSRGPLKLNAPSAQLANNFIHHEGGAQRGEGIEEDKGRNAWSTYPFCLLLLLSVLVLLPAGGLKRFFHHEEHEGLEEDKGRKA